MHWRVASRVLGEWCSGCATTWESSPPQRHIERWESRGRLYENDIEIQGTTWNTLEAPERSGEIHRIPFWLVNGAGRGDPGKQSWGSDTPTVGTWIDIDIDWYYWKRYLNLGTRFTETGHRWLDVGSCLQRFVCSTLARRCSSSSRRQGFDLATVAMHCAIFTNYGFDIIWYSLRFKII